MASSLLPHRAIIAVSGDEAETFLNRLFTNSMLGMVPGASRYAALLSPQGKLLYDFLVYRRPDAFWIDCRRDHAPDLAKKLALFKLRAKVTVDERAADFGIAATWGGALMEAPGPAFRDPRHDGLGYRIVAPFDQLQAFPDEPEAYRAHCVALGVPEGGVDFVYGDTFVHDANLDLLNGVDFEKGCYVGQEVVSRVHHRNSARKRIVRLDFYGTPPTPGRELTAAARRIGQVTSIADNRGLATARTDRLRDAETSKVPVLAGETLVGVVLPSKSVITAPAYADENVA